MPDKKLEYWYDWRITYESDRDGFSINLKRLPTDSNTYSGINQQIEIDRLQDADYLCQLIREFPEIALMNHDVWYAIVMLRRESFKDKSGSVTEQLRQVCKAIIGDGRGKKEQEYLLNLSENIQHHIEFFQEIKPRIDSEGITVEDAILDYLDNAGMNLNQEPADDLLNQNKTYENTYYEYTAIYDILNQHLTDTEIFCFFKKAAINLTYPNVVVFVEPENRPLIFLKTKTWCVKGNDMHEDSSPC